MKPAKRNRNRQFSQACFVFALFCALSLLSQGWYPVFGLVAILGIAFPLAWGKRTGNWAEMGFSMRNIGPALLWGAIGGVLTSVIGVAVLPERSLPSQIGIQLAIGVPIWALIVSPFQEFFFRGWLQTRFENTLGNLWGLLIANACFTIWHYFAPFVGVTSVPLETPIGALSTFGAGLIYAYVFQRTRNILAPWLAHCIAGITFIVVGAMDFTQPMM